MQLPPRFSCTYLDFPLSHFFSSGHCNLKHTVVYPRPFGITDMAASPLNKAEWYITKMPGHSFGLPGCDCRSTWGHKHEPLSLRNPAFPRDKPHSKLFYTLIEFHSRVQISLLFPESTPEVWAWKKMNIHVRALSGHGYKLHRGHYWCLACFPGQRWMYAYFACWAAPNYKWHVIDIEFLTFTWQEGQWIFSRWKMNSGRLAKFISAQRKSQTIESIYECLLKPRILMLIIAE